MRNAQQQRGEGKIGCIVTLLVIALLGAVGFKAVPVYFSNNEFLTAVENVVGRAGILPQATIEAQINQQAREQNIPEALAPGAIVVTKVGDGQAGSCTVRINYTRKIDFYGVFTYPLVTEKTQVVPYMDAR